MWICVLACWVNVHMTAFNHGGQKHQSPGAEDPGGCEALLWVLGTELRPSARSGCTLNC